MKFHLGLKPRDKRESNIYKNTNIWKFADISNIEEWTFNKVLEKFYNLGISGLVRENIQNSLDGKLQDIDSPVIVNINIGKIKKDDIPGLEEIQERIKCLQGRNSYTKETIEHMRKKMNQNEVNYISFEDYNTKGLKGAKNGQSNSKDDTWGIYAYSKGVHFEEEDTELENYRGGSHGIGKIASNAASDIYMMFFANCDEEGNKHLGGTVQLIEHKYKDCFYRSTGYFTDVKQVENNNTKYYPYENKFNKIFAKDTRGLKIIIPFLRETFNNEKEIIKSVCDSFFISIIKGKLVVVVNDKTIDSKTISDYILDSDYYAQEPEDIKKDFTPLYFNTYMTKSPIPILINDAEKAYRFKLYFDYNERIVKGRAAIIRTIGMKIEDKKIKGNVNKPFSAVLIPETNIEDAFLKSLENESHTQLSFEHIKDYKIQINAKKFISNISREISKIIEEEMQKINPTDGFINTEDIIYLIENQFKQDLSKATSTVKINKGNKDITIVKTAPEVNEKRKSQGKDDERKGAKGKTKGVKEVKRKNKEKNTDAEEKQKRYNANPDMVERIVLKDKEMVRFDFSNSEEFIGINQCDIAFSVIDGMGNEYFNEFNLSDNYSNIIDTTSGKQCKVKNNLIKDIEINKGIAQLQLSLKENFNKALKFVYYVEV